MEIIKPLTSLRFFAILAIFLFHLNLPIFSRGYIGVTFFFMLSGFLLSYRYYDKFRKPGLFSLRKFYLSRLSRIYPLHILTLLASVSISVGGLTIGMIMLKFFSNLFLVQSFIPKWDYFFSFNWVSWFLSDFLFCIFMFPFVMFTFVKLGISGKLKSLIMMVIIWIFAILMISLGFQKDNIYWFYYISPYMRLVDFVLGMLLGFVFLDSLKKAKLKESGKETLVEIAAIVVLLGLIRFSPSQPTAFSWSLLFFPGVAFMIYTFAQSKGILSKLLESKILLKLGELSFTFFLIHQLVIRYLMLVSTNLNPVVFGTSAFIISMGLSYLYQKYLETPAKDLFTRLIQNPFPHKNS